MRKKLDELQKYHKEVFNRVNDFKKEISDKEKEIDKVNKEFSKSFINGKKTDPKKINELRSELENLKTQYDLILKAIEEDEKIKDLAKEVYKEHYEHKDEMNLVKQKHMKVIAEKEKELNLLKSNMGKEVSQIKQEQEESKKERFEFIDYMDLNRHDRNQFAQDTVGLTYNTYMEQELKRQGKTVNEINEFLTKDFYNQVN